MIAISLPLNKSKWNTMSFASTLYLCPILDLLLAKVPPEFRAEIRLGLQEALVNAAKHGNKLDPSKTIVVRFNQTKAGFSWVISDQGCGFKSDCDCGPESEGEILPADEAENGRGLCILHQIFDQVHWNRQGTEIRLSKEIGKAERLPALV